MPAALVPDGLPGMSEQTAAIRRAFWVDPDADPKRILGRVIAAAELERRDLKQRSERGVNNPDPPRPVVL